MDRIQGSGRGKRGLPRLFSLSGRVPHGDQGDQSGSGVGGAARCPRGNPGHCLHAAPLNMNPVGC
jgi:hypothetical protein